MNGASNSLGNETGGNAPTGNPQNIGSQNIVNTNNNLQPTDTSLLNGTKLRLVDQNGRALGASTDTTTSVTTKSEPQPNNNHKLVIGISALLIIAVLVATWFMNHRFDQSKHA